MKRRRQNILLMGGGTGNSNIAGELAAMIKLLNLLYEYIITVVLHPYDDGKHTGRIAREYQLPGFGDYGKNILELSRQWLSSKTYHALKRRNWNPEFGGSTNLESSSIIPEDTPLRNLIMLSAGLKCGKLDPGTALLDAIEVFTEICHMPKTFQVLPISLDPATLTAKLANGEIIAGQSKIAEHFDYGKESITSISLVPPQGMRQPRLYEKAREAILNADKIVISPGSWWTSILPNTLPEGFRDAMSETKAKIIMVLNLVTEKSESSLWNSGQFVERIYQGIGRSFDVILCNDWKATVADWKRELQKNPDEKLLELLAKFERGEFTPVNLTPSGVQENNVSQRARRVILGRFAQWDGKRLSHNSHTVKTILDL